MLLEIRRLILFAPNLAALTVFYVSGGENAPINGDGDFFGDVWSFHRRPSALRVPSCSWL